MRMGSLKLSLTGVCENPRGSCEYNPEEDAHSPNWPNGLIIISIIYVSNMCPMRDSCVVALAREARNVFINAVVEERRNPRLGVIPYWQLTAPRFNMHHEASMSKDGVRKVSNSGRGSGILYYV
jgi:hypothetical protein